ncbi:MAG TPA: branched-chain amino acid ABC transporter permease [Acidimicrobiia bacterium]
MLHDNPVLDETQGGVDKGDTGRLSIPLAAGLVVLMAFLIWFPIGKSEFTPIMWLWILALVGIVTANLLIPVRTKNGTFVRLLSSFGFVLFLVVFPFGRANSTITDFGIYVVFAVCVIGVNLTFGYAGQVSIAQAAFLGIGAYTSVLLDSGSEVGVFGMTFTLPNLPFLLTILIAIAVAMLFSVLVGMPALRVRGPWLAFVTLAFNVLIYLVFINEEELTGGSRGIRVLREEGFEVFGIDMVPLGNYYYLCLAFLIITILLVWYIVRSPWGRSFKAIRDNADRAASLGVDVRVYTLLAFAIGSGVAGGAGALYARLVEYIEPRSFFLGQSFDFLFASVIGGLGTLAGPLIGTSFITIIADHLRFAGDWYRVWFALLAILTMVIAPKGVAGSFNVLRNYVQARRRG